jgi:glutamate/aspartate transport system substrate-binding protein
MNIVNKLAFVLSVGLFAGATQAEELTGTLKKIKDTGMITLGVREASTPFSYTPQGSQYTGYSYEIMMKVVEDIKKELNMPNLQHRLVTFAPQNRLALIQNGTIDFECTSTTNTLERQEVVSFSNSIFMVGAKLMTLKTSGIKDFADLKGKNVAVPVGTISERLLTKYNEDNAMGMNLIGVKDMGQGTMNVENGRAVAFMIDDAILYAERAKSKNPANLVIVGTPMAREAYGCMLKKDDAQFKKVVDKSIASLLKSDQIKSLYTKWFQQPIPPRNMSLDFPMSDDLKALYANPNDKAL